MFELAKVRVEVNAIIPFFNLPSTKGGYIKPWDYKQRKHLVIYFFRGADCAECRETLQKFAENYGEYMRLNAEVLAIGRDTLDNLIELTASMRLPYPVLSDENGEIADRYTYIEPETKGPVPSIFVADKFGSLEEEWIVGEEKELPGQDELLSLLTLFELRCPE